MDISGWKKLNRNVKILPTKKKFFNKFLYKAVIFCPAGRLISYPVEEFLNVLARRKQWIGDAYKSYYRLSEANLDQIQELKSNQTIHGKLIRYRIEEPKISVYCNDETLLRSLVSSKHIRTRLELIYRPFNQQAAEVLNLNEIIVPKDNGFKYKVMLRTISADMSVESKRQVLQYLQGLDEDLVKLPNGCIRALNNETYNNAYFYLNDESVLTFLNLIAPRIVQEIYKLTVVTTK